MRTQVTLLLLFLVCLVTIEALTVKIPAGTEECYRQPLKRSQEMTFQFQVTHGGMLDIDTTMTSEGHTSNHEIEVWKTASSGRRLYRAPENEIVVICFSNKMARWTPKWVSFHLYFSSDPDRAHPHEVTPIESAADLLHHEIEQVRQRHDEIRIMESRHRDLVEASNSWVLYWTLWECILLVLMGAFQVWYLKNFLETANVVKGYI
eukprot:PhF_6_TR29999/c0_g1_i1/m.43897/K20347/TMED2, EMP24; p24 family protein beta-1